MKAVTVVLSAVVLLVSLNSPANAQQFKFGILRLMPDGRYTMDVETTRIPRRLKETGFRFGVAIDNPRGETIEWYPVIHLPAPLKQLSGGLEKVSPTVVRGDNQRSSDKHIVDHFWFDAGDPLGPHRLEVFVYGVPRFTINFEVVEAR